MRLLGISRAEASDVDSLGHVNFSAYTRRVLSGHGRLLEEIGLGPAARDALGVNVWQRDFCSRFHKEQFAGALLETSGEVVEVGPGSLVIAYVVRNPEKDETAAAFLYQAALVDRLTLGPREIPAELGSHLDRRRIPAPPAAAPRTTIVWPPRLDISAVMLEARFGAGGTTAMMGGRHERLVVEDECDDEGFLVPGIDLMFDRRGLARGEGKFGPTVQNTEEVPRFSFAWVETRVFNLVPPRGGDRLVSLGAPLALAEKTQHARRWAFNLTTGELVSVLDSVGVSLDLDARRAVPIPGRIRGELAPLCAADLL